MIINSHAYTATESIAQDFIDAAVATGATITSPQQTASEIFLAGLQTDGITLKAFYPCLGGTAASCAINMVNPGTFDITWSGSSVFTSTGVAWSSSYGDTGFNPAIHSTVSNKLSIGYYTTGTPSATGAITMGCDDGSSKFVWIQYKDWDSNPHGRMFGSTTLNGSAGGGGLVSLTIDGSNTKLYKAASLLATQATASTAPNYNIFLGARNSTGFAGAHESIPMQCAFIGDELNSTQMANLTSRINTFMSSLGR